MVNAPVITLFAAADPLISRNRATRLNAVFTNGAGAATIGTTGTGSSDLTPNGTSGGPLSTGNLAATTTYTLTATNEAGNSTSASVTVTVVTGASLPHRLALRPALRPHRHAPPRRSRPDRRRSQHLHCA